jgi:glycosyltransferase involved in cell wall biosynthesis
MTERPHLRRIVLDGLPLQVQSAGIGAYTAGLVRALAQERPDLDIALLGISSVWLTTYRVPAPLAGRAPLPASVRWIESSWYPAAMGYPSRFGLRFVPLEAITGAADLFHGTNYGAPRRLAARLIVTVHDLALLRFPQFGTPGMRAHVQRSCARLPEAHRIIADSQATASDLVALAGCDPARIRVVYPACDPRFVPLDRDAARMTVAQRFALHDPYLLHVGTLEPRKNLVALLRAFARLRATAAHRHRLVLVGQRGWLYEPIFDALAALGLDDQVCVIDTARDEDLPALYAAADVFVYPSFYEGFGLPVLEAMACGTPVVTSDRSSLPEVAGDAALLADPEDEVALGEAMQRMLTDATLRRTMAERGLERAQAFSWTRCARDTLAVYEEALAQPAFGRSLARIRKLNT